MGTRLQRQAQERKARRKSPSPAEWPWVAWDWRHGKAGSGNTAAAFAAAPKRRPEPGAFLLGKASYGAGHDRNQEGHSRRRRCLAERAIWRAEIGETIRLAAPMALTQLGQISMMTTDLMLLGRLGDKVVAAAALAHTVLFAGFTLGMGFVQAVAPLAAQAFGARQPRMVRRALRVGLWAALMLGVPLTLRPVLGRGVPARRGAGAGGGRAGRPLFGGPRLVPRALLHFPGRAQFHERGQPARARPVDHAGGHSGQRPPRLCLIYGAIGPAALDLLGAGIATTLINIGMCVAAILIAALRRPFKKYRVLGRFWRPDWPLMGQLIAVGAADIGRAVCSNMGCLPPPRC